MTHEPQPLRHPDHDDLPLFGNLPPPPPSRFDREAFRNADREERAELIKQTLDDALTRLSKDLEAGRSESLTAYLRAMSHFHHYSFNNCVLIMLQRPDATRVAGFRTWPKLSRHVRKGEEGIVVMAPVTKIVGKREEVQDDGSRKEVPVRAVVNTKPVYVFDISQTDGEDLPEHGIDQRRGDPGEHQDRLVKAYAKHKIELEYVDALPGGALGVSRKGSVAVVRGLTAAETFGVLVHELAHELLHRDAERRSQTTPTIRETEAEAVAFVVCEAINLEQGRAASDYIQIYGGNAATLAESLEAVRQASAAILADLDA